VYLIDIQEVEQVFAKTALGQWLPVAPIPVMVMLGMVGYFAGVVQSPLTAFIIVMEMTNGQEMLLALISTSLIAHGVSHLVCPQPIYHALSQAFLDTERRRPVKVAMPLSDEHKEAARWAARMFVPGGYG
jgi:H+/Cl- antiporter ClcA